MILRGTVRYNLDPTGTTPDERLWRALEAVQLDKLVRSFPLGLEEAIGGGGLKHLSANACALLEDPSYLYPGSWGVRFWFFFRFFGTDRHQKGSAKIQEGGGRAQ